jgi:hypothetical protein
LRPKVRTSFHHQPEAQHPEFSVIHKLAGRLPHLLRQKSHINKNRRFSTKVHIP